MGRAASRATSGSAEQPEAQTRPVDAAFEAVAIWTQEDGQGLWIGR